MKTADHVQYGSLSTIYMIRWQCFEISCDRCHSLSNVWDTLTFHVERVLQGWAWRHIGMSNSAIPFRHFGDDPSHFSIRTPLGERGGGSKSPILGIIVNLTCWHSRGKESAPRYGASRYICPHAKLWFILPWGSTVQKRLAGLINRMSHSHTSCPSTMTMRLAETLCGDPDRSAENHISEVWADRHRNFDVN